MNRLMLDSNNNETSMSAGAASLAVTTPTRRILFPQYETLLNNHRHASNAGDLSIKANENAILPYRASSAPGTTTAGKGLELPAWAHCRPDHTRPHLQGQAHLKLGSKVGVSGWDRFVPRRRGMNFDHAYHQIVSHVEKPQDDAEGNYLELFEAVERATTKWRKNYMEVGFKACDLFRSAESKRVLNIVDESTRRHRGDDINKAYEFSNDSQWKCRPRKQPLLNIKGDNSKRYRDHGAQIFRFSKPIRFKHLIDWSAKDVLIAGLLDTMCLCCVDFKNLTKVYRLDYNAFITCLKWNHEGTYAAIAGMDSSTSLYVSDLKTTTWKRYCICRKVERKTCKVIQIVWSKKHNHLITACDEGILSILNPSNGDIIETKDFKTEILAISLSPQEQYFVESGADQLVKVFHYPHMCQLFEIAFFTYVKALAWHPWMTGLLCVGGGPGDGSLSLWNVNTQTQLGYRKIRFIGCVDTILFNQISAEMVVAWYYLANDRLHSKIVVMSSLDKVVDAVPIQTGHKILNMLWSPDGTKLAMQYRETFLIWDFFANELDKWLKPKETKSKKCNEFFEEYVNTSGSCFTGAPTISRPKLGKSFSYFNIR